MLTALQIERTKPGSKIARLYDDRGLYLEIAPTGHRGRRFKYFFAKWERRMSLGAYPEVSLKEAREKRDEARKQVSAGIAALQSVKGGFRGQVQTLISKPRHELLRREMRKRRTSHEAHDLCFFGGRQGIVWAVVRSASTIIAFAMFAPTLDTANRDLGSSTCLHQAHSAGLRLSNCAEDYLSFGSSVSSSSS